MGELLIDDKYIYALHDGKVVKLEIDTLKQVAAFSFEILVWDGTKTTKYSNLPIELTRFHSFNLKSDEDRTAYKQKAKKQLRAEGLIK